MDSVELERRRSLSFAQAEGATPLPAQLRRDEVPPALKSSLWQIIYHPLDSNKSEILIKQSVWYTILKDVFVHHFNMMVDEFDQFKLEKIMKAHIISSNYIHVYGLVQFLCHHKGVGNKFVAEIGDCLVKNRSPYRLIDRTIVPIASDIEHDAIKAGLSEAKSAGLAGAATHLSNAARAVSAGEWANSVRESIHAVESAARQISNTDSLGTALTKIAKAGHIHSAMNEGFKRLYGYTSDQDGIRHALLEDGDAKVTETDAMFMLGACASFVTYLTANARKAGLLAS